MISVDIKNRFDSRILLLIPAIIIAGCVGTPGGQDITPILKSLPMIEQFLKEHPNADIQVVYLDANAIQSQISQIREMCGEQFQVAAYYRAIYTEGSIKLTIYLDPNNYKPVCIKKEGSEPDEPPAPTPTETRGKFELLEIPCVKHAEEGEDTLFIFANIGKGDIHLCSNELKGPSQQCGDVSVRRIDGEDMFAFFDKSTVEPGEKVRFYDKNCPKSTNPFDPENPQQRCDYVFRVSNAQELNVGTICSLPPERPESPEQPPEPTGQSQLHIVGGEQNAYCNPVKKEANIILQNIGNSKINLCSETLTGKAPGSSPVCGDVIIDKTEGGELNASFNKTSVEPGETVRFVDENCDWDHCTYLFTLRNAVGGVPPADARIVCMRQPLEIELRCGNAQCEDRIELLLIDRSVIVLLPNTNYKIKLLSVPDDDTAEICINDNENGYPEENDDCFTLDKGQTKSLPEIDLKIQNIGKDTDQTDPRDLSEVDIRLMENSNNCPSDCSF